MNKSPAVVQETPPILPRNERTATIAMIAALVSPLPIFVVLLIAYFRSVQIHELHGLFFILMITVTPFLAVVGVGAAAMALDGVLTLYIGVAVGVGYTFGILALTGAVMIFLSDQAYVSWGWFCIVPAFCLGIASLFGIYKRRQRRAAASILAA
jgi:hypothetical protein